MLRFFEAVRLRCIYEITKPLKYHVCRGRARPERRSVGGDLPEHAKGRTGDCLGPLKETATQRIVAQGGHRRGGSPLRKQCGGFRRIFVVPQSGETSQINCGKRAFEYLRDVIFVHS